MENRPILTTLLLLFLYFPLVACTEKPAPGPTAIVIDAETGAPVEGVIVLAQWFSTGQGGLFEGGGQNLEKAQEAYSDKDGRIQIADFWERYSSRPQPRLTVYKPGYVLWDSQAICPVGKRMDFDEKHRTVKLLKFDAEAARWLKEGYDKGRGGPRAMHTSFFRGCYSTENTNQITFRKIFYKYEKPLDDAEEMLRREKTKLK